jgi:hypothetical protein
MLIMVLQALIPQTEETQMEERVSTGGTHTNKGAGEREGTWQQQQQQYKRQPQPQPQHWHQ